MDLGLDKAPTGLTDWFFKTFVPQTPRGLLEWRDYIAREAIDDHELRMDLWCACSRDPLFYVSTFAWILEVRDRVSWQPESQWGGAARELPFLPRDYQCDVIMQSARSLGKQDICVLKSRETGATWMYILLADWDCRFHPQTHIGMSSKDEPSVGDKQNPDSLLSKVEFVIQRLPVWMRGNKGVGWMRHGRPPSITYLHNESTITGFATGGNMGRGGRKRWWLMDELHSFPVGKDVDVMDSVHHVTPCRVVVSTPSKHRGAAGAFFEFANDTTSSMERIDIDWKMDKEKADGLYTTNEKGELRILDSRYNWKWAHKDGEYRKVPPEKKYPKGYEFILDGKVRSPYYDFECRRPMATPQSIAAELDKDFGAATSRLFSEETLKKMEMMACPPVCVGDARYDSDTKELYWIPKPDGQEHTTELWFEPKEYKRNNGGKTEVWHKPPPGMYAMGVDAAQGTGSAYSAIVVVDKSTGEQVFEFRSNRIKPNDFGRLCYAVGKWFSMAYMVIEANAGGGGQVVAEEVQELGYRNLYFRPPKDGKFEKRTRKVGVQNQDKGYAVLTNLEKAVMRDLVYVRSSRIAEEAGQYFWKNGALVHAVEHSTSDDSSKKKGHSDSAIAAALAWLGMDDTPIPEADDEIIDPPYMSLAWLRQQRQRDSLEGRQPDYWKDFAV